ncbi:hypothetical protein [Wenzhouxiangella sediminis]|nr:hypothetical protein [Wenzhouxiangella sediminis]
MTLIQARAHERLSVLGIPADHRGRYLSQVSGLTPERIEALLSGALDDSRFGTDDLDVLATALDVPGWWLVMPFDGSTQ